MSPKDRSKCQTLLTSLSDYVDGCLSQEICAEIDRHLAECQDCYIVVDTLRKTVSLYHAEADASTQIPEGVRQRLFKTLNLEDYLEKD